jgi:hypothetical protein
VNNITNSTQIVGNHFVISEPFTLDFLISLLPLIREVFSINNLLWVEKIVDIVFFTPISGGNIGLARLND